MAAVQVKQAELLQINDEILLYIDGQFCDVVVDGVTLNPPEVEITYHTRFLQFGAKHRIRLPRYHSVQLIDGL